MSRPPTSPTQAAETQPGRREFLKVAAGEEQGDGVLGQKQIMDEVLAAL